MTVAKDLPSLQRVVFASSYLIYDPALYQFATPQAHAVALKESDPILPRNLTGWRSWRTRSNCVFWKASEAPLSPAPVPAFFVAMAAIRAM